MKSDDYGNPTFTVYIRKVEKKDGKLVTTFDQELSGCGARVWHYDPKKFLEQPVFSRDFPPMKSWSLWNATARSSRTPTSLSK